MFCAPTWVQPDEELEISELSAFCAFGGGEPQYTDDDVERTRSGGSSAGGVSSGIGRGSTRSGGSLANGVPLATLYHAAEVLLQSGNVRNHFGPSVFEAESQWAGRDWQFGSSAQGTAGGLGLDTIVRRMEFKTHEVDGTVSFGSREWGVQVAGPLRPYISVTTGEPQYSAPLGVVRLEGWDLLRADTPSRSAKAVVTHASNYRYVTEQNLRGTLWPIIDAATPGGSYRRWWLKFWLDWVGTTAVEEYARRGVTITGGAASPMPAIQELTNQTANADSTFVESNLSAIVQGDVFIHDMSQESNRSALYAAFVRRYAASWPRSQRRLPGAAGHVLYVDQVQVAGASTVAWMNGGRGQMGAGIWPANVSTRQLLGLARQFMMATNSHADCMSGLELAVMVGFTDPYSNTLPARSTSMGDDPVVINCGRGLSVPVSPDNSLPAYLAPFYTGEIGAHVAFDLLATRVDVLKQELVYYHTALSQAHAAARLTASFTCDQLIAGVASIQVTELVRKEGVSRHISKFDRLVANTCAHMFGFIPHEASLCGESIDAIALALKPANGSPVVYAPMWIPQQWLGYEICEVLLMVPEGWALTGPGARFQSDPTKGAPGRDRHFSTNFVRLFRSLPVLDDYMWLGDGGQAHGASHICAGHGAHYYVQSRGWWKKPYLAEEPSAPNYLPIMWVDKGALPGVIVPGQFPVWHDDDEVNMAWGLRINPNRRSHELGGVLTRQPDCTRYRTFVARNGFLADDPTRVTRLMPVLQIYDVFKHGMEPGTPIATIERSSSPDVEVDPTGDLVAEANSMAEFVDPSGPAGSAPPRRESRGRWQTATARGGRKKVGIRQVYRMGSGNSGAVAGANRFSALADKVSSPADVQTRQHAAEATSTTTPTTQEATRAVGARTATPMATQTGPTDDELIQSAINTAKAERARMQAAGVGSAPPLKSYSEAVQTAATGATQVDDVTQERRRAPGRATAMPHPEAGLTARTVDKRDVAVPTDYVAPPSEASEDMLAAVASGALGKRRDPNVIGSKN
jgi:hypothetical protein